MKSDDDWYDTPLYYDIIFDEDTAVEAGFLEAVMEKHGRRGKDILEPACGSGRLVVEMAKRGYRVHGFDLSEPMLEFARERLSSAEVMASLKQDAMESFTVPRNRRFDLAHCFVSTFKYLLTEEAAHANLQGVADILKPGGVYVLGLHLSDYTRTSYQHERWTGSRNGVDVICNIRSWPPDPKTRLEPIRSRLRIEEHGKPPRVQDTHWNFRTYDAAQLRRLLRTVPSLEVVACYDFNCDIASPREFDDTQDDLVLILRRRE